MQTRSNSLKLPQKERIAFVPKLRLKLSSSNQFKTPQKARFVGAEDRAAFDRATRVRVAALRRGIWRVGVLRRRRRGVRGGDEQREESG